MSEPVPDELGDEPASLSLRLLTLVFVMAAGWYAMQGLHEAGHVLGAWCSGGRVSAVHLPLFGFSRTALSANPHPLLVVWAGPLAGCLLPLSLWRVLRRSRVAWAMHFFAGFCLLANGVYLGLGWIDPVGDTGDILREGGAVWQMVLFGVVASASGLWVWHKLGRGFGLTRMSRGEVWATLILSLIVVGVYAVLGWV